MRTRLVLFFSLLSVLLAADAPKPLFFDAAGAKRAVPAAGSINREQGTLSFWYKPGTSLETGSKNDPKEDRMLFTAPGNFRRGGGEYRVWFWNGYIRFDICDAAMNNVRFRVKNWQKDSWKHIAVTWDKNRGIALWINGVAAQKKDIKWEPVSADGKINFNAFAAKGDMIEDIRIFDQVLEDKVLVQKFITSPRRTVAKLFDSGSKQPGKAVKTLNSKDIFNRARGTFVCTVNVPADHQPGDHIYYTIFCSGPGMRKLTNNMQLWLWYGYVRFDLSNIPVNLRTSIKPWKAGEKHHVAVTWDCTEKIALWVDGKKVDEKAVTWTPDNTINTITFGEKKNPGVVLEDIQIFDAPLDGEVIRKEAEKVTSQNKLAATFTTGGGQPGYYAVRGVAEYKLNHAAGTAMFWYRPDIDLGAKGKAESAHGIYRLFTVGEKLDKKSGNLRLWVWNNYLRFDICTPQGDNVRTHIPLWKAGEARHIAVQWDAKSGIKLYVNGKVAAEKAIQWQPRKRLQTFAIGSSDVGGGNDGVAGQIVDIQLFDQVISSRQIAEAAAVKPVFKAAEKPENIALKTLFTLDFSNGLQALCGKDKVAPGNKNLPEIIDGPFGKAALFNGKNKMDFRLPGLIPKDYGSISFWLRAPSRAAMPFPVRSAVFGEQSGRRSGDNRLKLAIRPEFGLRFDPGNGGWGASYIQESGGWAPESWHHLVISFDSRTGTELYVDGRYIGCHGGEDFRSMLPISWKPLLSEGFCIGNDWGANANGWLGALDEFKIFSRKLTAQEAVAEYASYLPLPLSCTIRDGYVYTGKDDKFKLLLHNLGNAEFDAVISGSIRHEASGRTYLLAPQKCEVKAGRSEIMIPANVVDNGNYTVDLTVAANGKKFSCKLPLWGIGEDKNFASGMEKELVCEVDAAKVSPLVEFGSSSIVNGRSGTYREAGNLRYMRFFVPFEVKEMHTQHLAVIEYPDDKARTMEILMQPFNSNAGFMGHTGVFTGNEYPLSGKMRQFELYFWPQSLRNGFIFMTVQNSMPAAVDKIRIYKIKNRLPELDNQVFKGSVPGRKISLFHEDPVIPFIYGRTGTDPVQHNMIPALLPFMDEVFTRMLDYNRFFGVNTLHYPIAFYRGAMFDSDAEPNSGIVRPVPPDYVKYILRRLNNRRMKFYGVINSAQFESLRKYVMIDPVRIRNGEDTVYSIRSDGQVFPLAWHRYDSAFNPLDPRVQQAADDFIADFLKRYSDEPALEGVTIFITRFSPFNFGSMETGYNDGNIAAFEKASGIRIPVSGKDPERFNKRFNWLRENRWQQWIDFRARAIYEYHSRLAKTVKKQNPAYKLNLAISVPVLAGSHLEEGRSLRELLLESGIDLNLYAGNPDINLIMTHRSSYYRKNSAYSELPFGHANYRTIFTAPEILRPLREKNIGLGVNLFDAYFETDIGLREPLPGLKEKYGFIERRQRASHMNAGSPFGIENHVFALENCDALEISKGGFSIGTLNMEKDIARFAAAFCALPAVRFQDVPQLDDPVRVRTAVVDNKRFIYVLNRLPFAAETVIDFDRPAEICDLVSLQKYSGKQLTLKLEPYELRSFSLPENCSVTGGRSTLDPRVQQDLAQRYAKVAAKYEALKSKAGNQIKLYADYAADNFRKQKWARLYYLLQEEWVSMLENLDNPVVQAFTQTSELYIRRRKYPRSLSAVPLKGALNMDGKLDDAAWKNAPEYSDFGDYFEYAGKLLAKPAAEKTIVKMLYDDRYIYFGIRCETANNRKVTVKKLAHDSPVWLNDDSIEIYLSCADSERGGHGHFALNAANSKCELFNNDINWNPAWDSATAVEADAYTMEIKIPFSVLGKKLGPENSWTLNIARNSDGILPSAIVAEQNVWWNCEALFARIKFLKSGK